MLLDTPEKIQVVIALEENSFAVIAAIVEVIALAGLKWNGSAGHAVLRTQTDRTRRAAQWIAALHTLLGGVYRRNNKFGFLIPINSKLYFYCTKAILYNLLWWKVWCIDLKYRIL